MSQDGANQGWACATVNTGATILVWKKHQNDQMLSCDGIAAHSTLTLSSNVIQLVFFYQFLILQRVFFHLLLELNRKIQYYVTK